MSFFPAVAAFFGAGKPPAARSEQRTTTDWSAGHDASWRLPYSSPATPQSASVTTTTLHQSTASSSGQDAAYPHLAPIWSRIRRWCRSQFPEVGDTLNPPATPDAIQEFERVLGRSLPPAVKESFLLVNGQDNESLSDSALARSRAGVVLGLPMLSIEESMAEWGYWRHVDSDPSTGANAEVQARMASCPEGWVAPQYSHPGWVPLVTDRMGNYIGVDLSPPVQGHARGGSLADALASTSIVDFGPTSNAIASSSANPSPWGTSREGLTGNMSMSQIPSLSTSPNPPHRSDAHGHGEMGQVILFGRDFDTKFVLHSGSGKGGWAHFLSHLADMLESGSIFALDEVSSESEDDEDYIGYESYFGGTTGSNAVGGGLASEHLGGYGFRLRKPYKGLSVLEALADQSIQRWEAEGYSRGISPAELAWRHEQEAAEQGDQRYDDGGQQHAFPHAPPEGEDHREDVLYDPLQLNYASTSALHPARTSPTDASADIVSSESDHPLSPTMRGTGLHTSSSSIASSDTATPRRRPPPPQPADSLALPTIEDVQAVQDEVLQDALGEDYQDMIAAAQRKRDRSSKFLPSFLKRTSQEGDLEAGVPARNWGSFLRQPSDSMGMGMTSPRNLEEGKASGSHLSPGEAYPSLLDTSPGQTPNGSRNELPGGSSRGHPA